MSAFPSVATLDDVLASIGPLDDAAMALARQRLARLTKPVGSLGRLEELVITLAGIKGRPDVAVGDRHIVLVAADHGVAGRGVSAYPSTVTAQMVANFLAGGAAVNVLARAVGAELTVVDAGVAGAIPAPGARIDGTPVRFVSARLGSGTDDMTRGPAMSRADALRSIDIGLEQVEALRLTQGLDLLAVGEMGIGNTTAASALAAALTARPVIEVTGRGTGVDDAGLDRKIAVIEEALAVNQPDPADPVGVLAAVGGFEIGVLVGLLIGAAANRIPVVLDGFITGAAALVASAMQPVLSRRLIASHRAPEPGHAIVLGVLGLRPYLDLEMRLGEGSGAALVLGLIVNACRIRDEMATFESAAISGPTQHG